MTRIIVFFNNTKNSLKVLTIKMSYIEITGKNQVRKNLFV